MKKTGYLLANPDIVFRKEKEGAFLFNPDTGDLKVLNTVGAMIWEICDGKHTEEALLENLSNMFIDVSESDLEKDIKNFIKELEDRGLIGYIYEGTE